MGLSIYPPPMVNRPWTAFTPQVFSSDNLTTPVSSTPGAGACRWKYLDRTTILAHCEVTINAATNGVHITLPVTAAYRQNNCGTLMLYGTGTPTDQCGMAFMSAQLNHVIVTAATTGYRNAAAGNTARYTVIYEIAPV
ncbi:hypothetical protein SEA_CELESTE_23 [Streptomyces phage Celeste]|uniref:Uncharacterized protein n=1 Tax=Streptomyces phage Celeste TaxID=2024288 RepID=A0A291AVL9_9CAUD|nr:hypothetical protein SEA_CELESTE_23 [Streptomyces phage Celeste]